MLFIRLTRDYAGNPCDVPPTPAFTSAQRSRMSDAARATLATEFGI